MEEDENVNRKSKGTTSPRQSTGKGKSPKNKQKIKKKKQKPSDDEIIQLPTCGHNWCLGEILKQAGIEPGVCYPRPLPWALTGKLRYLPGWERQCRRYKLQKIHYNIKPKKVNPDKERYDMEMKEAKHLWSYLAPAILFPTNPTYEDPQPGVVCNCKAEYCKRDPPF